MHIKYNLTLEPEQCQVPPLHVKSRISPHCEHRHNVIHHVMFHFRYIRIQEASVRAPRSSLEVM